MLTNRSEDSVPYGLERQDRFRLTSTPYAGDAGLQDWQREELGLAVVKGLMSA